LKGTVSWIATAQTVPSVEEIESVNEDTPALSTEWIEKVNASLDPKVKEEEILHVTSWNESDNA
jgi:hypothetical protein